MGWWGEIVVWWWGGWLGCGLAATARHRLHTPLHDAAVADGFFAPRHRRSRPPQLQIHGPVELRRHVLVLVLPASLRPAAAAGATLAASFAAAHGVPVVWGDEPEKLHALW